jgi:hypothetical protein
MKINFLYLKTHILNIGHFHGDIILFSSITNKSYLQIFDSQNQIFLVLFFENFVNIFNENNCLSIDEIYFISI